MSFLKLAVVLHGADESHLPLSCEWIDEILFITSTGTDSGTYAEPEQSSVLFSGIYLKISYCSRFPEGCYELPSSVCIGIQLFSDIPVSGYEVFGVAAPEHLCQSVVDRYDPAVRRGDEYAKWRVVKYETIYPTANILIVSIGAFCHCRIPEHIPGKNSCADKMEKRSNIKFLLLKHYPVLMTSITESALQEKFFSEFIAEAK